jgi:CelD/BcsL family acetyltransferase involved in cellulose biosynthesis
VNAPANVDVRPTLAGLEDEWDRLVDGAERPNPFLRSWWLAAFPEEQSRFVLLRDGAALVGGAAFAIDRERVVNRCRLLGSGPLAPHQLDALAAAGREPEVASAVESWLRTAGRVVDLQGVTPGGIIDSRAPSHAVRIEVDRAPWIDVPSTFEDYLASRSSKLRQEIRRVRRRLEERGFAYRVVPASDATRALDTLMDLHVELWGDASKLRRAAAVLRAALEAGATREEVVYQEIVSADRVIASLVTLEVDGCSFWYQMGRDPDPENANVGTLLKSHAVERSCELGHRLIDLCVGAPPTKRVWADEEQPVIRTIWAQGTMARALSALAGRAVKMRARREREA